MIWEIRDPWIKIPWGRNLAKSLNLHSLPSFRVHSPSPLLPPLHFSLLIARKIGIIMVWKHFFSLPPSKRITNHIEQDIWFPKYYFLSSQRTPPPLTHWLLSDRENPNEASCILFVLPFLYFRFPSLVNRYFRWRFSFGFKKSENSPHSPSPCDSHRT